MKYIPGINYLNFKHKLFRLWFSTLLLNFAAYIILNFLMQVWLASLTLICLALGSQMLGQIIWKVCNMAVKYLFTAKWLSVDILTTFMWFSYTIWPFTYFCLLLYKKSWNMLVCCMFHHAWASFYPSVIEYACLFFCNAWFWNIVYLIH